MFHEEQFLNCQMISKNIFFNYLMSITREKIIKPRVLTDQEIKANEEEIDSYGLKQRVKVKGTGEALLCSLEGNGVVLETMGDLRPYIKSTKIARKFENFLHVS
jgi:hypothetical protein